MIYDSGFIKTLEDRPRSQNHYARDDSTQERRSSPGGLLSKSRSAWVTDIIKSRVLRNGDRSIPCHNEGPNENYSHTNQAIPV